MGRSRKTISAQTARVKGPLGFVAFVRCVMFSLLREKVELA